MREIPRPEGLQPIAGDRFVAASTGEVLTIERRFPTGELHVGSSTLTSPRLRWHVVASDGNVWVLQIRPDPVDDVRFIGHPYPGEGAIIAERPT